MRSWVGRLTLLALFVSGPLVMAQPADDSTTATLSHVPRVGEQLGISLVIDREPTADPYKLLCGDSLSLVYHFGWPPEDKPYPIQPGDEVMLNFRYSPELSQLYASPDEDRIPVLSRPYIVEPDGKLWLAGLVNPVQVGGKTTVEFAEELHELYRDMLTSPSVQVAVVPIFEKQTSLKELFQSFEDRPVSFMETTVAPDGRIAAPLVPEIMAAGQTPAQLSAALTERYRELGYPWTTVSVLLGNETNSALPSLESLRPPNHTLTVTDGGRLHLPWLPPQEVDGRNLAALAADLEAQYRRMGYPHLRVYLWSSQRP